MFAFSVCTRIVYLVWAAVVFLSISQIATLFLPHDTDMDALVFPIRTCFPIPNATMPQGPECPADQCRHPGDAMLPRNACVGSFVYIASSFTLAVQLIAMLAYTIVDALSRYNRAASREMVAGMGYFLGCGFAQACLATLCAAREASDFLVGASAAWGADPREPALNGNVGVLWGCSALSALLVVVTFVDAFLIARWSGKFPKKMSDIASMPATATSAS